MLRIWNKKIVLDLVKDRLSDYTFAVVSNRQPYIHRFVKSRIECSRGPGGVITALDPVMKELKGLWICCGSGDADRQVAGRDSKVQVPPEGPSYVVKFVWLSKQENLGYYYGYANAGLWPLSHLAFVRPVFREEDWHYYKVVNKKFAESIAEEIKGKKAIIFVQDYHLGLVGRYLKEIKPDVITALFWHIPWPHYDVVRILPQGQEFLRSLLSYDLIGFHTRYFCYNFLETLANELEVKINKENLSVTFGGNTTLLRAYPISVDFEGIQEMASKEDVESDIKLLREEFNVSHQKVIVGVDRIDYTKGIPERIKAVDKLLDRYPELKENVVYIQIGEISRIHLSQYKNLNDEINALVEDVNFRHSQNLWRPIIFLRRHLGFKQLLAFYRIADVGLVTSLQDGMNLVAKEFISSRIDGKGVLVLSRFTGAARELKDAILVNPYSLEDIVEGLYKGLHMDEGEVRERMKRLRQVVQRNNIWKWIGKILSDIAGLRR